jgi:2-keto-4-pentenoate hydratase
MDKLSITQAAAILVDARRTRTTLPGLPERLKPTTLEDAYAIQDEVSRQFGKLIAGFKAIAPAGGEPMRGVLYGGTIHQSPAQLPVTDVPHCGVEAEVAFVYRKPFPPRETPYTRDEVAAGIDACVANEVVSGRYDRQANVSNLERLADSILNGGLVHNQPRKDWQHLDLGKLHVTLAVNGQPVVQQEGGHPTGDPLGVAVVLANLWRDQGGVRAGQVVTCGSYTGLRYINPGDVCTATFEGLGSARVEFVL